MVPTQLETEERMTKRKMQSLLIVLTLVSQTVSCATARAQSGVGDGQRTDGQDSGDPLALYKQAGINQTQEKQITDLVMGFEQLMLINGKVMSTLMQDMKALSQQAEINEQAAVSKQAEINKLNGDMAIERIRLVSKIRKVLTPEQRQKLIKLMQ